MSASLVRATFDVGENDLPSLALSPPDIPDRFRDYTRSREERLDNRKMAERGFAGSTEERFRRIGRVGGFVREFWSPTVRHDVDGADALIGSAAHLFDTPDSVSVWMRDVFVNDFENNVGADAGSGQTLVGVDRFAVDGFFDEAVGLRARYDRAGPPISATIIDFRVGRILGVVYVATIGDHLRAAEASELGIAMEKTIVSVALGG